MSKVEVDEAAWTAAQRVVNTVKQITANPRARDLLLQSQKVIDPALVTPEDHKNEIRVEITKERDARLALEKRLEDEKVEREVAAKAAAFENNWNAQKAELRSQGYMDDAIAAAEKLAQERGIPDLEAAMLVHIKHNPPASPVQPNGFGGWDFFAAPDKESDYVKTMLNSKGDDDTALRGEIDRALAEVRGGQRRAA